MFKRKEKSLSLFICSGFGGKMQQFPILYDRYAPIDDRIRDYRILPDRIREDDGGHHLLP